MHPLANVIKRMQFYPLLVCLAIKFLGRTLNTKRQDVIKTKIFNRFSLVVAGILGVKNIAMQML